MQSVHPRNRLDKVVGLKRLVDIQHGILRLIKPGEQFINDYQQFLEATWVDDLKKEFTVKINQETFEIAKQQLK